ncbi:uracil-DNA glycosylase [Weissella coleopterorum]|uniref:Uracil-DNA glycosylase n=1 Tax=Weissella coleopterorum TaxID=2714949 RepID=A0A6G8AZD4_9LACO|nr:uracil-DNA glycosylase [Weissella coleopterorum]QIL50347.1 uracil-DNA glycosylase [Weissella coleopterorum]
MSNLDSLKGTDWWEPLNQQLGPQYWKELTNFIEMVYQHENVYPALDQIFKAFELTPLSNTKVVLLGQDPYPNANQAMGLSFSVPENQALPKSLVNVYKELSNDLQQAAPQNGDLTFWAQQGVLLLNTILTVPAGKRNGHANLIWEPLTDAVITVINQQPQPVVYLLWGKPAGLKSALISNSNQLILQAPHPSPLAAYRGFFGSRPFSKINQYLVENKIAPINWNTQVG